VRIVAFDTAGPVVGVGLWDGARVCCRIERVQRGTEALLLPWAVELAAEAGLRLADLDAVAVAHGPGAFTGLRVGLATAAGLALASGVPLWSGCSLRSRAERVLAAGLPVLAMLDARKDRVYAASYGVDGELAHAAEDVPPEQAIGWMRGPFVATGEGARVYGTLVRDAGGVLAEQLDDPAVDVLVRQAVSGLERGEGRSPVEVRPLYLRAPDAKVPKQERL
jgi:tRNA threonylcarbamoyladenosine biosynthesis protein TsaB